MVYKDYRDIKLSALGFGAMRLPVIGGDDSRIDEEETFKMVDEAMAAIITIPHGVIMTVIRKLLWERLFPNIPETNTILPPSFRVTIFPIWER